MPPKPKFSREEIVAAALELVSERGIGALSARELGEKLGSSPRPIFTVFSSMEEVQRAVRAAAHDLLASYILRAVDYTPEFKQMGIEVIRFAQERPQLFRLLFLESDGAPHTLGEGYLERGDGMPFIIETMRREYDLDYATARELFHHVWIFTFGIGALCATGVCRFTDEEISDLLGQDFLAVLARIRAGETATVDVQPKKKEKGE